MQLSFVFILFLFSCVFSFYIPGVFFLDILGLSNVTQKTIYACIAGIATFLFLNYIFSYAHMMYVPLVLIVVINIWMIGWRRKALLLQLSIDRISLLILTIGSVCFALTMFFSGWQTQNGMQFIGVVNAADGLLHIGYTKSLLTTFPPNHAGLEGVLLRGYHYFYDLLVSRFVVFYHFSPFDLYYRLFPIAVSLLYGWGFYLFATTLTKNKLALRSILFFAYFAQSFAFVVSLFVPGVNPTGELGIIYPLELILNPAIVLSMAMFLVSLTLFFSTQLTYKRMLFIGFLFGMIVEMKVYTGIIAISTLSVVLFLRALKEKKQFSFACIGILTMAVVGAIIYIPNNWGAAGLWFSPFFAYSIYMQDVPFTSWHWELQRIIFRDHHNIPHLISLYAEAIGIFWFLTLGSRLIFLLGVKKVFAKKIWMSEKNVAIMTMIIVPIIIGSLFVQSVSIFDIKQFFWIAGTLIAIPAGLVLGDCLLHSQKVIQVILLVVVIGLCIPGFIGALGEYVLPKEVFTILPPDERLLAYVGKIVPKGEFILYFSNQSNSIGAFPFSHGPVVAAFTGRQTYFEAESAQFALDDIYTQRKQTLLTFGKYITNCQKKAITRLMREVGTKYIVATNRYSCLDKLSSKVRESTTGLTFYEVK